jgi:hypothetical protein
MLGIAGSFFEHSTTKYIYTQHEHRVASPSNTILLPDIGNLCAAHYTGAEGGRLRRPNSQAFQAQGEG